MASKLKFTAETLLKWVRQAERDRAVLSRSNRYARKCRSPHRRTMRTRRAPARVRRDGWLSGEIRRVYAEHFEVYGEHKVWRQLRREGVARCTVAPDGAARGGAEPAGETPRAVVHDRMTG